MKVLSVSMRRRGLLLEVRLRQRRDPAAPHSCVGTLGTLGPCVRRAAGDLGSALVGVHHLS